MVPRRFVIGLYTSCLACAVVSAQSALPDAKPLELIQPAPIPTHEFPPIQLPATNPGTPAEPTAPVQHQPQPLNLQPVPSQQPSGLHAKPLVPNTTQQTMYPPAAPQTLPSNGVVQIAHQQMLPTGPAKLAVKQVLPEAITPGQDVECDVVITNTGGEIAENVMLTGWWSNGYELKASSVVAQVVNNRYAWGLGSMAGGESRTVRVKLSPQATAAVTEFRSGFDATFSTSSDTRSVKIMRPELHLAVEAPKTVFVGQSLMLLLKVKNPTTLPISRVTIKSVLPDAVSHPKGNELESELARIEPGMTETIPLNLSVVRAGEGRAVVRIGGLGCDAVEQEIVFNSIEARMGVTMNGPKSIYQNWPATFEAVVENQGDQTIEDATFEVKLPPGLTELRASNNAGYDGNSHRIVWKLPALKPGEKKTLLWFGVAKQSTDLVSTGTVTVGGSPMKRAETTTHNLGTEENK